MRVLLDLESTSDAVYDSEYHHKARGAIWSRLEGTKFGDWHGDPSALPFCFSNPYPVRSLTEGDVTHLLVASPHTGLIHQLAERIPIGSEFNIGEMGFSVSDIRLVETDVGAPGTSGTIRTDTGVYIPIPVERWDEFGISPPTNGEEAAWTPNMPLDVFMTRIRENLNWKQNELLADYLNPVGEGARLFDKPERHDTYSVDIPVTSGSGYEYEFIVSKWNFEYTVRNSDHRRWLNLFLDCGIGTRNNLGFGFCNVEVDN